MPLSALLVICGILRPSVDTPAPHFLLPLGAEFLNLYSFLSILQCTQPGADSLSFAFPRVELNLKFEVSPCLVDLDQLFSSAR